MTYYSSKKKDIIIKDGIKYTSEDGPYCDICDTYMGAYYNVTKGWINPNDYEDYGTINCHNCGQRYSYTEGFEIILTKKQLKVLKNNK